jgi:DNA-binding NarL/FixJ family response regulator
MPAHPNHVVLSAYRERASVLRRRGRDLCMQSYDALRCLDAVRRFPVTAMPVPQALGARPACPVDAARPHRPMATEHPRAGHCPLSAHEFEVAALVADGLTNAEIGRRLV